MPPPTRLPAVLTRVMWAGFGLAVALAFFLKGETWSIDPYIQVDGLTQVMAVVVTFVSGIVHSFSRRYMAGARHLRSFYGRLFSLSVVVLLLTATEHVVVFLALWTVMGWLLASLIGHIRRWPEAQASARFARRMFLAGSGALAVSFALLVHSSGAWTVSGFVDVLSALPRVVTTISVSLIVVAAMMQSALVPFHRWLLSSMTAPTPVSAFMHAGLVNAGGVLLARFSGIVFETDAVVLLVFFVGAVTALAGQAWALVQTNVKRQLGCSTTAQMGFMVMQFGLGFGAAGIAHLILHGFYKAYLFLASGSVVESTSPPQARPNPAGWASTLSSLVVAVAAGFLFAWLTGKSVLALDGGTLLVFFVVLAVLHATRTLLRRTGLPARTRAWALPFVLLPAILMYAAVYKGVAWMLAGTGLLAFGTPLTPLHWGIAAVFTFVYVGIDRGWHHSSTRLYVLLMNTSQPVSSTLLTRRDRYHVH
ncbi:oxidoreductase [Longibacter salinarum]|uniref:Oxidoreductase n=1 Tax=Longibacter salinarum TaxID=1850348 RepID=A0A2A8CWS9_9BACT|nr:proton-conducting transporter membrane subunit [Longibacter salinarum]PEN13070.1 oxidoreductase [Longibacter salinarum]